MQESMLGMKGGKKEGLFRFFEVVKESQFVDGYREKTCGFEKKNNSTEAYLIPLLHFTYNIEPNGILL